MSVRRLRHVFFVTDLEGVAGVSHWRQTRGRGRARAEARHLLTDEINAAVGGLRQRARQLGIAPVPKITIWDGHGTGGTVFDDLDPEVEKHRHDDERGFSGLLAHALASSPAVDALGFLGQHAMEGSGGNLAHTYSSRRVRRHLLNGVEIGEFGTRALNAWALGVPSIFFSGDDVACREATSLVPGLVTVAVKRSRSVVEADSLPHEESCRRLAEAAGRLLDVDLDGDALRPRFLPAPPYTYRQIKRWRYGLVPRPHRTLQGDDLADVLGRV